MEHHNQEETIKLAGPSYAPKNDTLAKKALEESLKKTKKKVGRPPTTWIKLIEKDLSLINIQLNIESNPAEETLQVLHEITANRKKWRRIVKDIIAENR